MAKHHTSLLIAILLSVFFFVIAVVFNALAGTGVYPFLESTGNISYAFSTEITPSGWTFSIWPVIYVWLVLLLVFTISGFCRKNAYGYVYCSPPVLSHGFFVTWCFNLSCNVGWLFLWDRRLMPATLAFLLLIASTNYIMIFFSCHGLHIYGAWINKYHKVDLWLHRVLVQNGVAIYATWTTIASLLNLTIVLTNNVKVSPTNAATISLSILAIVLILWFILENSILDKLVRYILIIYPVVIWALSGVLTQNYDTGSPGQNDIFVAGLLATACALFVTRVVLVILKHLKHPLYADVNPEVMSPMETAANQKNIFH
ncbi:uncharacterized protein si:ch211-161h7.5 [Thalassophryne amazonica]|uniref:uncharacterized protein si:ch211-161h7.5 n=1 Tax=Thalassophryne amazonica TaxID=390379 RepID=UPI0014724EC1|nr:uncharacterized protein si:ch211-161h7.5 [Thalassophryne amazonica]